MARFADKEGRSWEPEVDVVTIGRVRAALKINLLELLLPNTTLPEQLNDPCLIVDVLYLLCRDEADRLGMDSDAFGRAMTPDGIEDGWDAVLEGLVLFSPRGLRAAHQKVLEKAKRFQATAAERLRTAIESPEFEAMLDREIDRRLNPPATWPNESTGGASSSPASSASRPDETPSPA
jgi:hypothetical protein